MMGKHLHIIMRDALAWWVIGLVLVCFGLPVVFWALTHGLGGLTAVLDAFVALVRR